ncbi:hypothetical protein C1I63_10425 [Rathayibacter caricis DSM 15933]|uniref:Phosphoribosyltransferase domain-containing protein n=1 Tax=Rathayibacter caricis DSM 15933 TaxID=1328867 RepID=A0A2T4UUP8_9MICO|nr:phosphoribosyltransferase family protein [Rathayibacter caricis]PTL73223.1 hypothetical protein C1I63_10425 [Rathayibacter caricis DSM 15933]
MKEVEKVTGSWKSDLFQSSEPSKSLLTAGRAVHLTMNKSHSIRNVEYAAKRFWRSRSGRAVMSVASGARTCHIIAIAMSGVELGAAVAMTAPSTSCSFDFTVVDRRYRFRTPDLQYVAGESIIIVDNSIHTGRTMIATLHALRRDHGVSGSIQIVKYIDYQDPLEREVLAKLRRGFGAQVFSVLRISELTQEPSFKHLLSVKTG